jgi:hypothetical protein
MVMILRTCLIRDPGPFFFSDHIRGNHKIKKKPLGQRAVQDLRLNEVVSDIGIYLIML